MKIRGLSITIMTAAIGAVGFLWANDKVEDSSIVLLTLLATLAWTAFYTMDIGWYHKLLKGAVEQGRDIERKHGSLIPEIKLALKITDASEDSWLKEKSNWKLHLFYIIGYAIILIPYFIF